MVNWVQWQVGSSNEVDSVGVELGQELHEVVDVHGAGALLAEVDAVQDFVDDVFDFQILRHLLLVERTVHLVVLLQHHQDGSL